jgi:hypothetical protein
MASSNPAPAACKLANLEAIFLESMLMLNARAVSPINQVIVGNGT